MHIVKFSLLFVISILTMVSCNDIKETTKATNKIIDRQLREELISSSKVDFNYFYSKLNVDYKTESINQSFKSNLKMTIDSAFSGTISYSGFIIANFLATEDSLKATYKQKKCYFMEHLSYVSSIIGIELEFDFFQNMLLGKSIGVDEFVKYKQIKDKAGEYYILSSHRKRKFKKIEKEKIDLDNSRNDDIFIQYYFSPDSLELVKQIIEIPFDTVSITINYLEKEIKNNVTVPKYTTIKISHLGEIINIGLTYNKQAINRKKRHSFSIPQQYENCNP